MGVAVRTLAAILASAPRSTAKRPIIIVTDFNTDPGDAAGVSEALMAHQLGWCQIVGIVIDTSAPNAPASVDSLRKWFGIPAIELAAWKGESIDATDSSYVAQLATSYDLDVGDTSTVEDSTTAMRRWLAAASDNSIEFLGLGYLAAMQALMASSADGESPLTGANLIEAKVKATWIMAGQYPSGSEFNMRGGSEPKPTFCAASADVAANWPGAISWMGFEFGESPLVGADLGDNPASDPRRVAFAAAGKLGIGNSCWDDMVILLFLDDEGGISWVSGTNVVDDEDGSNVFTPGAGKDRYVVKVESDTYFKNRIEALLFALPTLGSAPTLNWNGSPAIEPVNAGAPVLRAPDVAPIGNLLPNGTFNSNVNNWTGVRAGLQWINGRMAVLPTDGYPGSYASLATDIGQTYTVSGYYSSIVGGLTQDLRVSIKTGSDDFGVEFLNHALDAFGAFSFDFVAEGTQTVIFFIVQSGAQVAFEIDSCYVV